MKTIINFEICKKLYDNGLLSFNGLEYSRYFRIDSEGNSLAICKHNDDYNEYLETYKEYPSLTLEEAIEFLKNNNAKLIDFRLCIDCGKYLIVSDSNNYYFHGETLLEAIEKLLEYLIDKNKIGK